MKSTKKKIKLDLYPIEFYVVQCDSLRQERPKWDKYLDDSWVPPEQAGAVCCFSGNKGVLIFTRGNDDIKTVAHEVFHLTHVILEAIGANFDKDHHEQGAYLNGFLMERVCEVLE